MRRRLSDAWTHPSAERAARLGTAGIPHRLSAGHALAGRRGDRIWRRRDGGAACAGSTIPDPQPAGRRGQAMSPAETKTPARSEEHTSELQSLMRISYAVFCLKKKNNQSLNLKNTQTQHSTQLTKYTEHT